MKHEIDDALQVMQRDTTRGIIQRLDEYGHKQLKRMEENEYPQQQQWGYSLALYELINNLYELLEETDEE